MPAIIYRRLQIWSRLSPGTRPTPMTWAKVTGASSFAQKRMRRTFWGAGGASLASELRPSPVLCSDVEEAVRDRRPCVARPRVCGDV